MDWMVPWSYTKPNVNNFRTFCCSYIGHLTILQMTRLTDLSSALIWPVMWSPLLPSKSAVTVQSARLRVFLLSPDTAAGNEGLLCLPWDGDQFRWSRSFWLFSAAGAGPPGKVQLIFSMLIRQRCPSARLFHIYLSIVRLLIATARTNHQSCGSAALQSAARPPFLVPKRFSQHYYFRCLTSDLVWYLEWLSVVLAQL